MIKINFYTWYLYICFLTVYSICENDIYRKGVTIRIWKWKWSNLYGFKISRPTIEEWEPCELDVKFHKENIARMKRLVK